MLDIHDYKYLRIQGREIAANTMVAKGVFSICYQLLEQDVLEQEDADLFHELDSIIADILPWPPQCKNQEKVVCYFKTENANEVIRYIRPILWLLDKYKHPYYLVYTNYPGEIVYEDKYQVVVKVEDQIIQAVQKNWTPEGK